MAAQVTLVGGMERARRHHRALAAAAFGLLALVAELVGRSLTHRLDVGRHVESPSYSGADYYPFLLGAVKLGVALLAARLVWRFVRARSAVSVPWNGLSHLIKARLIRPAWGLVGRCGPQPLDDANPALVLTRLRERGYRVIE